MVVSLSSLKEDPSYLKEGIRLFEAERFGQALEKFLLVNSEALSPEQEGDLSYFLGLCYTKLCQYEDALVYLEQVIGRGTDLLRTYQCRLALAYIYANTGRANMAEFELTRLLQTGFESPQVYDILAYAAWSEENFDQAVQWYEKALAMDEANGTAMNGLGFILADTGRDVPRGLRYCRRAVEKSPQSAAYQDSLGWAYYKTGDLLEARTWLRRALDTGASHQEIRSHMRAVVEGKSGDGFR